MATFNEEELKKKLNKMSKDFKMPTTEDLDNNTVLIGSVQEAEPTEQEAEAPVEIDNDEEPNEQPVVSEV